MSLGNFVNLNKGDGKDDDDDDRNDDDDQDGDDDQDDDDDCDDHDDDYGRLWGILSFSIKVMEGMVMTKMMVMMIGDVFGEFCQSR